MAITKGTLKSKAKRRAHIEAIEEAKAEVKKTMAGRPTAYVNPELFAWRLAEYFMLQEKDNGVITVAGMARALGVDNCLFERYAQGKRDIYSRPLYDKFGARRQGREPEDRVREFIRIYRFKEELYPYYGYLTMGTIPPAGEQIALADLPTVDSDTLRINPVCKTHDQYLWFSEIGKNAKALLYESVERGLATSGKIGDIMRAKVVLGWQDERTETHKIEVATKEESRKALQELKLLE